MTRKGRSSCGGQAPTYPYGGTTCSNRWPWAYASGPKELSLAGWAHSATSDNLPRTGPTLSRMKPSSGTLCSERPWDSNPAPCAGSSQPSGWRKSCAASPLVSDQSTSSWPRGEGWYRRHRGPPRCGQSSPRYGSWRRGSTPAGIGSYSGLRSSPLLRSSVSRGRQLQADGPGIPVYRLLLRRQERGPLAQHQARALGFGLTYPFRRGP